MPGIREAIEEKRYSEAEAQVVNVAKVLQAESELINRAAEQLEGNSK